jgi:hypothetical protein
MLPFLDFWIFGFLDFAQTTPKSPLSSNARNTEVAYTPVGDFLSSTIGRGCMRRYSASKT